jgi:hypothetical protein
MEWKETFLCGFSRGVAEKTMRESFPHMSMITWEFHVAIKKQIKNHMKIMTGVRIGTKQSESGSEVE